MKKIISLITAMLLLVGLGLPALAEDAPIKVTKVYEVAQGELLGSTNLVAFRAKSFDPTGIMGPDGTVLVPDEYLWLDSKNPWGYIEARYGGDNRHHSHHGRSMDQGPVGTPDRFW